jgi:hypothetical protein
MYFVISLSRILHEFRLLQIQGRSREGVYAYVERLMTPKMW